MILVISITLLTLLLILEISKIILNKKFKNELTEIKNKKFLINKENYYRPNKSIKNYMLFLNYNKLISLNKNDFFRNNNLILNIKNKNYKLNKTQKLYNNNYIILVKYFQKNNYTKSNVVIKNNSKKDLKFYVINKLYLNVTTPTLHINNNGNVCSINYHNNTIINILKVNNKIIKPSVNNINDYVIVLKKYFAVKAKSSVIVSVFNNYLLNISTMQTTMQNLKSIAIKPNNCDIVKYAKEMFNFTIITDNEKINNLINNILPSKIVDEFNLINNNENLYNYVFNQEVNNLSSYNYKYIIDWLYKRKEYARLYKYLLDVVLGVKIIGNILNFTLSHHYMGKVLINLKNIVVVKYNLINSFYFTYNNIIYKNVNILNLNNKFVELNNYI